MYCVEKHQTTSSSGTRGAERRRRYRSTCETADGAAAARVAVTQPRRVAAQTVAQRVAEEVGCVIGDHCWVRDTI